MINKMYSLLDHQAQMFLKPLSFTNDGDAIRWFTTTVNAEAKDQLPSMYPEQFTLYRLADYDDQIGCFKDRENEKQATAGLPKELITGIQVKDEANNKYTIKEIAELLKKEYEQQNVHDIKEAQQ